MVLNNDVMDHFTNINPQYSRSELIPFDVVNIMVADALAPSVARTSAAMISIK